jgi:hypothetical protein
MNLGKVKLKLKVMKRNILVIGMVFGLLGWSCSKVDNQTKTLSQGLKQSIEQNAAAINSAINKISTTKGYQVLSLDAASAAKDVAATTSFKDSITLGLVAGIYDYQPDTILLHHNILYPFRLFKKTGTSNQMIINLPQKLIFSPRYLHSFAKSDSVLVNDFTISASDYHLYYNSRNNLDYKLTAGLTLSSVDLGSFDISESSNSYNDQSNSSQYTFPGGYTISTAWQTGDTSKMSFAFLQNSSPLLKETTLYIGTGFHRREKQYDLIIGNVEIKRGFGIDSIQVFQNGVLQKTAGAKITDSPDSTGTIFSKRDILLTFDDGTTEKLSTLIDPAITQLKTLFTSLHDMYFAENIVDYIAINIYFNSR